MAGDCELVQDVLRSDPLSQDYVTPRALFGLSPTYAKNIALIGLRLREGEHFARYVTHPELSSLRLLGAEEAVRLY